MQKAQISALNEDEKSYYYYLNPPFEAKRLYKIKNTGQFESFEDEKILNTTDET